MISWKVGIFDAQLFVKNHDFHTDTGHDVVEYGISDIIYASILVMCENVHPFACFSGTQVEQVVYDQYYVRIYAYIYI